MVSISTLQPSRNSYFVQSHSRMVFFPTLRRTYTGTRFMKLVMHLDDSFVLFIALIETFHWNKLVVAWLYSFY